MTVTIEIPDELVADFAPLTGDEIGRMAIDAFNERCGVALNGADRPALAPSLNEKEKERWQRFASDLSRYVSKDIGTFSDSDFSRHAVYEDHL